MQPEINLYIDQGTDFSFPMTVTDSNGLGINLGTAVISARMIKEYNYGVPFDFVCTGDAYGNVVLSLPPTVTSIIPDGRYYFDAFYVIDSVPTKFLSGLGIVFPSVTIIGH